MSIAITLYKVNKKRNSSKLPSVSEVYLNVSGNFVEDSSFFNPTVVLSRDNVVNVAKFNYFAISWPDDIAATRYYWVTDKVIQKDGCLRVSGTEDCYATFRSKIYGSTFYVKRSSESYNAAIADASLAVDRDRTFDVDYLVNNENVSTPGADQEIYDIYDGFYVLGISAPEVTAVGSITSADTSFTKRGGIKYYEFKPSDMDDFIQELERLQVGKLADHKLTDFIVSCMFIPINIAAFDIEWSGTSSTTFMLSYNEDNNDHVYITIANRHRLVGLIPDTIEDLQKGVLGRNRVTNKHYHPDYSVYGDMVNTAPYTSVMYIDPVVGVVDLFSDNYIKAGTGQTEISGVTQIGIDYQLDLCTGYAMIDIFPWPFGWTCHKSISGSVGIPITLSAITTDSYVNRKMAQTARFKTAANSIISIAGATAAGAVAGGLPGAAAGFFGGYATMLVQGIVAKDQYDVAMENNAGFDAEVIGSNGTLALPKFVVYPCIVYKYIRIKDTTDFVKHPRLTYKSLAGSVLYANEEYAICENAQLSDNTGLTYNEESIICEQLNSGFFFE